MKKKILLSIFMVLFVLCMVGAASCGKSDPALKDWTDETIELGYGQTYTLDLAVEAEDGESYAVTASVKTKDGETVDIVNGAFIANEKTEYIVTYVCVVEEKEYTRTVTIKVLLQQNQ